MRRALVLFLVLFSAVAARAGNLTVKSPTDNAYLGTSNQLRFLVTGATFDVTVTAKVTGAAGTSTFSGTFTPNADGQIDNSISLDFGSSTPQGDYTITATATEQGNTYPTRTIPVKIDTVAPKFLEQSPNDGQFVKGTVRIRLTLKEPNMKEWSVRVNGQAIPNNTGTSTLVAVDWDTSLVDNDGSQTISVTATDQAGNSSSRNISVTLDRTKPITTITYPTGNTRITSGTTVPVLIDITDLNSQSVSATGVDVILTTESGQYLARVALVTFRSSGGNAVRWTGRIRYRRGDLPSRFKLVVTTVDRAGNRAVPQEVLLLGM
ncbi:hypothetical protein BH11ARM2_BH11ARM2_28510 [soil metagenome]